MQKFLKGWLSLQGRIAVFLVLCMIFGLIWSRAILSIAIAASFANALHPSTLSKYWHQWRHNLFAKACFLFFLTYLISGLWSINMGKWWASVANQMSCAILPFAFFALPLKEKKFQKIIVSFLLLVQLIIIAHSLSIFFSHFHFYVEGYLHSHSLPTTKYNDHIRFSLGLVVSLIMILYYLFENKTVFKNRYERWFLWGTGIIFILYLHILASKTGLMAFYITLPLFGIYFLTKHHSLRKYLAYFILACLLLPVLLYFSIPTYREKVNYVFFETQSVTQKDTLNYNYSDAGRLISYKMALHIWQHHKWIGTGVGDLRDRMDTAYKTFYPKIPAKNRLIPHSQYFYNFTAFGLIFGLPLLLLCFASFYRYPHPKFYGRITAVVLLASMLAEAMLEIQFGIFIFLFFLLYWQNMPPLRDTSDKAV